MSYQNGGYGNGGGGNQTPRKYIPIAGMYASSDKNGNWMAKGKPRNLETWMVDLLLNTEAQICITTNTFKSEDRQPDLNLSLAIPEDQLPQEYWDWEADRKAARDNYEQRETRPTPAPPGGRGGRDTNGYERQAPPAQRHAPRGEAPSREPYPPRQEAHPRQVPGRARPSRREPEPAYDGSDPFEE